MTEQVKKYKVLTDKAIIGEDMHKVGGIVEMTYADFCKHQDADVRVVEATDEDVKNAVDPYPKPGQDTPESRVGATLGQQRRLDPRRVGSQRQDSAEASSQTGDRSQAPRDEFS